MSKTPANQACNKASEAMINSVGAISNGSMDIIVNNGGNGRAGTANGKAAGAIDRMSENLDAGLPTKVNIDRRVGQSSADKMGDHFVVIMGKTENISSGQVTSTDYRYFDPGTRYVSKGTSPSNTINVVSGQLQGNLNKTHVVVTSIRQSNKCKK